MLVISPLIQTSTHSFRYIYARSFFFFFQKPDLEVLRIYYLLLMAWFRGKYMVPEIEPRLCSGPGMFRPRASLSWSWLLLKFF